MKYLFTAVSIVVATQAFAWDGTDSETGNPVEIEKGNLVRQGQDIEYFDYEAGEYRTGEVQSIDNSGSSVDVEITDQESGEARTLEMDDN